MRMFGICTCTNVFLHHWSARHWWIKIQKSQFAQVAITKKPTPSERDRKPTSMGRECYNLMPCCLSRGWHKMFRRSDIVAQLKKSPSVVSQHQKLPLRGLMVVFEFYEQNSSLRICQTPLVRASLMDGPRIFKKGLRKPQRVERRRPSRAAHMSTQRSLN